MWRTPKRRPCLHPVSSVSPPPLSAGSHQLCRLAVFPVSLEPAHGRGNAGGARDLRDVRNRAPVGEEVRKAFSDQIRQRAPARGDKWHMDEVVISIAGEPYWLWRAVDQNGFVLDVLVQRRRDSRAAQQLMRKGPSSPSQRRMNGACP